MKRNGLEEWDGFIRCVMGNQDESIGSLSYKFGFEEGIRSFIDYLHLRETSDIDIQNLTMYLATYRPWKNVDEWSKLIRNEVEYCGQF